MRFHQSQKLGDRSFCTAGSASQAAFLMDVPRQRQGNAAKRLHSLRQNVDCLVLLGIASFKEQMQFIEVRAAGLPVRLPVLVPDGRCMRQQAIQCSDALMTDFIWQRESDRCQATEFLYDRSGFWIQEFVHMHPR